MLQLRSTLHRATSGSWRRRLLLLLHGDPAPSPFLEIQRHNRKNIHCRDSVGIWSATSMFSWRHSNLLRLYSRFRRFCRRRRQHFWVPKFVFTFIGFSLRTWCLIRLRSKEGTKEFNVRWDQFEEISQLIIILEKLVFHFCKAFFFDSQEQREGN